MFCKSQGIKLEINAKRIISYSFCVNAAEQFLTTHLQTLRTLEIFSHLCSYGSSLSIVVFGKNQSTFLCCCQILWGGT